MVSPVTTGIVRRNVSTKVPVSIGYLWTNYSENIVGSKQAKPVDRPLPYYRRTTRSTYLGPGPQCVGQGADQSFSACQNANSGQALALASNKSYEMLKSQILNQAQLGASLAEYNQASAMVSARATQLITGARALRRLDFSAAAKAFSVRLPPGKRFRNTKSFGNLWLEFHFGWRPLVSDLYEGTEVMCQPVKTLWAKASASERWVLNLSSPGSPGLNASFDRQEGVSRSTQATQIVVNNPNVVLLNGLGLLNPASIAWELVPFSFVADWYGSMGAVLASMTDFMGCTLVNPYRSESNKFSRHMREWYFTNPADFSEIRATGVWMQRVSGLSGVTLLVKPLKLPSLTRAATQVSLLSQFLGDAASVGRTRR